ncbi:MAG: GumN family protein [Caulobacteraceae bacterium]|nr:GumN family protein [Caulobacteraceae bacterium]
MKMVALALAAALVAWAAPAAAQFGPTLDERTTVVEELVVRGFGGPPWWKVTDKDTTLYILADPGDLPPGVTFDQRLLERRVAAANTIVVAPRVTVGLGMVLVAPRGLKLVNQLNGSTKTDLEPSLPPDVRARFAAARSAIGRPETRYGALSPGLAGIALAGDVEVFRQSKNPPPKGAKSVEAIVLALAKPRKVRVIPSASYGSGIFGELLNDLRKPGMPCLVSSLDAIEAPVRPVAPGRQREIVEAWTEGDVRPLLDSARSSTGTSAAALNLVLGRKSVNLRMSTPACINAMPLTVRMKTQYIGDQVATLERVLGKPGQAVAVLDAGMLLMTDGILDQLRRKGFTVTAPNAS